MPRIIKHDLLISCIGVGLTLIAVGLLPTLWPNAPFAPQPARAQETNDPRTPTGDNGYCLVCHSQTDKTLTLADGNELSLSIDTEVLGESAHGTDEARLGCVDCHTDDAFPHQSPPQAKREVRVQASTMCVACHTEHTDLLVEGAHAVALNTGNMNAATCVDCHGAHDTRPTEIDAGVVAQVCSDCHQESFGDWQGSQHVELDRLGCSTCHLPHEQTIRFEDTSEMCLTCHKVPSEIYVHTKHLESDFAVSCVDCHMYAGAPIAIELVATAEPSTPAQAEPLATPAPNAEDILAAATATNGVDHTMQVDPRACSDCHGRLDAENFWEQRPGVDQQLVAERDDLQAQVNALEVEIDRMEATSEDDSAQNYLRLTQGLIFGLGLGLTLAWVFVYRLRVGNNHQPNGSSNITESAEGHHGESH
jgi:hypothetical protein